MNPAAIGTRLRFLVTSSRRSFLEMGMAVESSDRTRPSSLRGLWLGLWLGLGLMLLWPSTVQAQTGSLEGMGAPGEDGLVDRVVAVVGDSAIFYSQVAEQVIRLQASGLVLPEDPAELAELERGVLDEVVNQMLMLNAAAQDTLINVPEGRLEQDAESAWQDVVARFGSEVATARALEAEGLTMAAYRATQREEIRKSILLEMYVQARRGGSRVLPVEERAMREFFDLERENLGERPATMTFEQVVIGPRPNDSVRAQAREEALEVRSQLDSGEDFAELARRFSDDPGSAPRGGELGWVRRGVMVEEFEEATFRLGRSDISDVVETQFGAHIIQVERIRGAERLVRHILIAAEPTPADFEAARQRAQEIREEVEGGVPLESFIDEGEDAGLPHPMTLPLDRLGQLPSALSAALGTAEEGAVLGPIEIEAQPGQPSFSVIQVLEIRQAGELTFEDVRDQIRQVLQDQQFQDQLYERLRSESHIEIRW